MKIEDIEIHTGPIEGPYREAGWATCTVNSLPIGRQRTIEEANAKLREVAVRMRANAVINVTYRRKLSPISWRSLVAEGDAVLVPYKACPSCVETVRGAASICRYCGHRFAPESVVTSPEDEWDRP